MEAVPPAPTRRLPLSDRVRPAPRVWPRVVIPLGLLAIIVLIALRASTGSDGRTDAASPSPPDASSPTTEQPTPEEAPALSPQEAAGVVLATVSDGVEAGEVDDGIGREIDHQIDEILRDLDKGEDVEKVVEKLGDLRDKVSEALDKGEITSAARASAIDDALLGLAETLGDAEQ
jgi:hypothetical protein